MSKLSLLWFLRKTSDRSIRKVIDKHGQFVMCVYAEEGDSEDAPFVYTIGNHEHGLPELLIVGFGENWAGMILNLLGAKQRDGGRGFEPGEFVDLGGAFPVRISEGGAIGREVYAQRVGTFYRTRDFALRQVILPDPDGRWPEDPACALPFSRQPILLTGPHRLH